MTAAELESAVFGRYAEALDALVKATPPTQREPIDQLSSSVDNLVTLLAADREHARSKARFARWIAVAALLAGAVAAVSPIIVALIDNG
jgi:hypothetical protein